MVQHLLRTTLASEVPTFVSGTGLQFRNPDKVKICVVFGIGKHIFTVYLRWNKSGSVIGDPDQYVRLFRATSSSGNNPALNAYWNDSTINTTGEPNDSFRTYVTDSSGSHFGLSQEKKISSTTNDRWYHMFLVVTSTSLKISWTMTPKGLSLTIGPTISTRHQSLAGSLEFNVGGWNINEFDGDISSFHVFNYAMTLSDAQDWADYVDRGYINQGSPATLDYLANVSSVTPSDGQVLAWNDSTSKWNPKDENITEIIEFGLGVFKTDPIFKIDGISGNDMFYYTNNGSVFNKISSNYGN